MRLICGEFNGNWWRNCSPRANPVLTKQDFIDAWRRVVDIFRQEDATNVAWVWTPNSFPPPPADWGIDTDLENYYPGDNYVDWVGVDHYVYGPPSWMDPEYNFAVVHNKPFFLAEWGVRFNTNLTPSQQQQWLNDMFDYFESHQKIKSIVYFNYNMNGPAQWNPGANHAWLYNNQVNYVPNVNNSDSRLLAESGANFRGTFATRIGNPRYVSNLVGSSTDNLNPTVSVAFPANNATISGTVNVATNAADNVGVTRVEFYVDGQLIITDAVSPYFYNWDTSKIANGSHILFAKAYDAAGNVGISSAVIINVNNNNYSPQVVTVLQSSPANINAQAGQSFTMTYNWSGGPTDKAYQVFTHFTDSTGQIVFQDDHAPPVPTNQWFGAQSYTRTVTVPASIAPGAYRIMSGLYDLAIGSKISLTPGAGVIADTQDLFRYQIGTLSVVSPTQQVDTFSAVNDFSSTQGYRGWWYVYNFTGAQMAYNFSTQVWEGKVEPYLLLWGNGGHPGNTYDAIRRWIAPNQGSIRITGNAADGNAGCGTDGVEVIIRKVLDVNNASTTVVLWDQVIQKDDTVGYSFDKTTTVVQGDAIDFVINKGIDNGCDSTVFNPTIVLTSGQ
ncbi:hypothetical protein KGQ34_01115 [Patescibacteria group bacterium]|nr:hypothetical protein [Patescibacteria group bacterium]